MLQPLAYHRELLTYLRQEEPSLWEWFSSDATKQRSADNVRMKLLTSTYRLDEAEHESVYSLARQAAAKLSVTAPITLYQAQDEGMMNAGLVRYPDEAHIVLSGPLSERLRDKEWLALFGHELGHFHFWSVDQGQYLVADEILAALSAERRPHPSHLATARLFEMHTEVFCDRGSLLAVDNNLEAVVGLLIKMETGLGSIGPTSFLRQVEEVFTESRPASEGLTHPETFIRARSLQLWAECPEAGALASAPPVARRKSEQLPGEAPSDKDTLLTDQRADMHHARTADPDAPDDAPDDATDDAAVEGSGSSAAQEAEVSATTRAATLDDAIYRMLAGPLQLEALDLIGQNWLVEITRRLIDRVLEPEWMRTKTNLNHAKLFFRDYEVPPRADASNPLIPQRFDFHESTLDYFCYVLLDFATVDRQLENAALANSLRLAGQLELAERIRPIVTKELRMRKKQYAQFLKEIDQIVASQAPPAGGRS